MSSFNSSASLRMGNNILCYDNSIADIDVGTYDKDGQVSRLLFFIALLISSLTLSAPAFSETNESLVCGMEIVAGGEKVMAMNGEICPEDVAFQALYLFYQEIFDSPFWREIALVFVDERTLDSPFTNYASSSIGVAGPIYTLLSAIAVIVWVFATPIIAFKGWSYFTMIQKTGSLDFSETKGDTVKFVTYTGFLIVLLLPVGGITFGQGFAVMLGLPSIYGGNMVFSTYLSAYDTASTEVSLTQAKLLPDAQVFANEMIESELCQARTRQAIMSLNGNAGSHFFSNGFIQAIPFFGEDQGTIIDRYSACLGYIGEVEEDSRGDSFKSLIFKKKPSWEQRCPVDWGFADAMSYDADLYGYDHTCGRITYDNGVNKFDALYESTDSWFSEDLEDKTEDLQREFNLAAPYASFKRAVKEQILQVISSNGTATNNEKYIELENLFMGAADSVIKPMLTGSALLNSGSNEERQLKYLVATNALLGGTIDESPDEQVWMFSSHQYNRYFGVNENREHYFGVDYLLDDARESAQLFQRYHCAKNWSDHTGTRLFIAAFNTADADDLDDLFSSQGVSMECVEFLSEDDRGSTDFDRYARYPVLSNDPNMDIQNVDGIWVAKPSAENSDQYNLMRSKQELMETEVAAGYFVELRLKQLLISGYNMAVKKAASEALTGSLSDANAELAQDTNLRMKGWPAFGGSLLYMSQNYGNAKHMVDSIENAITITGGGSNEYFVETSAFNQSEDAILKAIESKGFRSVDTGSFFIPGASGAGSYPGPGGVSNDDETERSMDIFVKFVTDMLFGPIEHIKSASGMPAEKSLSEGFKSCYSGTYDSCLSGQKHPIVALSNMGNDIMSNMLSLLATDAIVKVLNRTMFSTANTESGDLAEGAESLSAKSNSKKTGWAKISSRFKKTADKLLSPILKLVKGLARTVFVVISAISIPAEAVLSMLVPFALTMFMVGAFFAYIVPMLAFIYNFGMLLLWIVAISVTAFIIPIYALYKLITVEKDYENGFHQMYEGFLGPYLKPFLFGIGAVISWTMVSVSLFLVNTLYSVLDMGIEGTTSGSFGFTSIVFQVMMLITYFVILFVMVKESLGFMKSFPDEALQRINLQRGNDAAKIDGLGFENYVNASIMKQIASMPHSLVEKWKTNHDQNKNKTKAELRSEAEGMEDFMSMVNSNGGAADFAKKFTEYEEALKNGWEPGMNQNPGAGAKNKNGGSPSAGADNDTGPSGSSDGGSSSSSD